MDIKDFVDEVKLFLKAGDGGNGCVSFRREKYVPFGGPDGGMGGNGGSIYIVASSNINTLTHLALKPHIKAENGEHGKGSNKCGKSACDTFIYVPVGTIIKDINGNVLCDLTNNGDKYLAAKGGKGGRGNVDFKSSVNRAPKFAENGEKGEEKILFLELMMIADVGIVGFPNAGKSTLLSRITKATPKIADYPFTTLNPNLGVCVYKGKTIVFADIPGLIEGASDGKGLGDRFLKHILRTKMILHLVDPLGFYDIDPIKGIEIINREIKKYAQQLAKKEKIIVINKSDIPNSNEVYKKIKSKYKKHKVFLISAVSGDGICKMLDWIIERIDKIKCEVRKQKISTSNVIKVEKGFEVIRQNDIFYVLGKQVENIVNRFDINNEQALKRVFNILKKIGVIKHLLKHGIKQDNRVVIGSKEFIWKNYY